MTVQHAVRDDDECQNCGMIEQLLVRDHCMHCICAKCARTAEECGSSMNDMGWCDGCEAILQTMAVPDGQA